MDKPAEPARVTHLSLERGLRVLEIIAANGGQSSLAETARRVGLHRSTTHHLLQTLVGLNYLQQDQATRGYELTAKLFALTGMTWTPEQLAEIAAPFLANLTERTGEGSSFAVYRDGMVKVVAKHDPKGPVRVVQDIGAQRPIHATAVGKAIIAFLPEAELAAVLNRCDYKRFTPKTYTTRPALEGELRRIRSVGVAQDDEEHLEGIRCIAAPVRTHHGQVVASVCSLGPKSRMTRQKLRGFRNEVATVAQELSARLGWDKP